MANVKNDRTILQELLSSSLYKRNQGRLTRQLTWLGAFAVVFLGSKTLYDGEILTTDKATNGMVLAILVVLGGWTAFRMVNFPRFADFLISVQAEMDKVTWAPVEQLKRSTVVVITTMFFLGFLLFGYDWLWLQVFKFIGFLEI